MRAATADQALLKEANEGMDALMVFAGLFSAVIATLIQITWSMLAPGSNEYTDQVLLSIYNATINEPTNYPTRPDFQPENGAIVINVLFFLSLVLSLGTALGAMLVKEWARQYDPAAGYEKIEWLKARNRHRRYEGYTEWPLRTIHATLPMIIHVSLLLFLIGIILWTKQLHYSLYLTILGTAVLGIAGYLTLACVPTFMEASPFKWPLSQAIRGTARSAWVSFKKAIGSGRAERRPAPPYILSPVDASLEKESPTQLKPSPYTTMDAAVLIDLLCNSSIYEEVDAAIDNLIEAEWGDLPISSRLIKHHEAIFRNYHELAATCWDAESNRAWKDMSERTRRLLRFLEWLYYQLDVQQRRQIRGWPNTDLAKDMRDRASKSFDVGDLVLAESVLSKLHHVSLPPDTSCQLCISPQTTNQKYKMVRQGSRKPKHYAEYYQNLFSACIWSDTDCILHYAAVGDEVEHFKSLTRVTLDGYEYAFSKLGKDVSEDLHQSLYLDLRRLSHEKVSKLPESDLRRLWFMALDRVRENKTPFPEDQVLSVHDGPSGPPNPDSGTPAPS